MKTKLFNKVIKLAALVPAISLAQDANLSIASFQSYYNTYDNNTKQITGIQVVVGADGTNSNNYISSDFETSLYLLPCDNSGSPTSSNPIIIATYTVFGGTLHQMGTYTFSNQSVDLSQVAGLADGMYRMGAWVNSDPNGTGIGNPPDDQSDNAGLLESSGGSASSSIINFTSASGIKKYGVDKNLSLFPIPASQDLSVKLVLENGSQVLLEICDVTGKTVQQMDQGKMAAGTHLLQAPVNQLDNGIYFLKVRAGDAILSKKFVVSR